MLCCPGLKQDRKLFRDRIRVLISEPEPEPDPQLYLGAGTGPESLVRSRNRIRVLISDPEPHSYSGAGTVYEKLTLSATTEKCTSAWGPPYFSACGDTAPHAEVHFSASGDTAPHAEIASSRAETFFPNYHRASRFITPLVLIVASILAWITS